MQHKSVEEIRHNGETLAIVLRAEFRQSGIHFFTPGSFSQQLGYMGRPQGHVIPPHIHNPVAREVQNTQEVLFIKSGRVRVDFYDYDQRYLECRILESGDVILLACAGHGLEMLAPTEIIEVKQGPYAGDNDKTCFEGTDAKRMVGDS